MNFKLTVRIVQTGKIRILINLKNSIYQILRPFTFSPVSPLCAHSRTSESASSDVSEPPPPPFHLSFAGVERGAAVKLQPTDSRTPFKILSPSVAATLCSLHGFSYLGL